MSRNRILDWSRPLADEQRDFYMKVLGCVGRSFPVSLSRFKRVLVGRSIWLIKPSFDWDFISEIYENYAELKV